MESNRDFSYNNADREGSCDALPALTTPHLVGARHVMATFDPSTPEVWYVVPGFPAYEISSHLRARTHHRGMRNRVEPPRPIKIGTDDRGYKKLILWQEKKYYHRYLHHVVAELALGPRPEGMQVLHRDDDKSNNWPDNLYYGTQTQNLADCKANGHFVAVRGEQKTNSILTEISVIAIRRLNEYGVARDVLSECFGVDLSIVCNIINRKRWTHVE